MPARSRSQSENGSARGLCRLSLALLLNLILTGCASEAIVPTAPEKPALATAPRIDPVDAASAREHRRLLAAFGGEYRAASMQALIDESVARLANATERPDLRYRVTILNTGGINAFALPTGYIYVTRGLLALANDTSELSAVLAHEMAHVTARHAIERAALERRSVLVSRVNTDLLNDPQTGQQQQDQGRIAIASFSRQQELEADQISVRTLAKAGYDPYGAARFLQSLARASVLRGRQSDKSQIDFLATHPSTPERVEAALSAARQMNGSAVTESDRSRYLNAVNGIIFGDDPADGLVIGNSFVHPRLGFGFTAPPGFNLENSAQAVLGTLSNGQQALRFEAVKLTGAGLEDDLKKSPIPNAPTTHIEPFKLSGFQAATALANGEDWSYRFGLFQSGSQTYRMILAAQSYSPEVDRSFRATLSSFHALTSEEIAGARAQRITVVTAQSGDTAQSLAARMIGERQLERFLVLNGLNDGQEVKAGLKFKLITD